MTFYQDAHLHLQDSRLGDARVEILAEIQKLGINKLVVNGTSPEDWNSVQQLHQQYPKLIIPSYGLHPWNTPYPHEGWKELLETLITENPSAGIGECGLDRWMKAPNHSAQVDAFLFQLDLAARLNRPLSIHVLKAWGCLLDIVHSHPLPARGFLLHSFGGSKEVAQQLVKLGAYFSFSGYFLQKRKSAVPDAFRHIPLDRILVETDAPDMQAPEEYLTHPLASGLNHPANLIATETGLAAILDIDPKSLRAQLEKNFYQFFQSE